MQIILKLTVLLALFLGWSNFSFAKTSYTVLLEDIESVTKLIHDCLPKAYYDDSCALSIVPIGTGLTNKSFQVTANEKQFFVRIGNMNSSALGIDRQLESAIYQLIQYDDIAPEMLYFNSETGNYISTFVSGTPYGKTHTAWLYDKNSSMANLIDLMKKYHRHTCPPSEKIDYPFDIVNAYLSEAYRLAISLPQNIEEALKLIAIIKDTLPSQPKVLSHHDLYRTNFIYDGNKLYLVDWEYANWSDPLYDLAALCVQQRFDNTEKEIALTRYYGTFSDTQRDHLEMMCMLYNMRCALWCYIQSRNIPEKKYHLLQVADFYYSNFFKSYEWLKERLYFSEVK